MPVEFINDAWHILLWDDDHYKTRDSSALSKQEALDIGLGYWKESDPQHPEYEAYVARVTKEYQQAQAEAERRRFLAQTSPEQDPSPSTDSQTSPDEPQARMSAMVPQDILSKMITDPLPFSPAPPADQTGTPSTLGPPAYISATTV